MRKRMVGIPTVTSWFIEMFGTVAVLLTNVFLLSLKNKIVPHQHHIIVSIVLTLGKPGILGSSEFEDEKQSRHEPVTLFMAPPSLVSFWNYFITLLSLIKTLSAT